MKHNTLSLLVPISLFPRNGAEVKRGLHTTFLTHLSGHFGGTTHVYCFQNCLRQSPLNPHGGILHNIRGPRLFSLCYIRFPRIHLGTWIYMGVARFSLVLDQIYWASYLNSFIPSTNLFSTEFRQVVKIILNTFLHCIVFKCIIMHNLPFFFLKTTPAFGVNILRLYKHA